MAPTEHRAVAVPAPGFEDVCAAEIKELLGTDATGETGIVTFDAELLRICGYIYRAQTPNQVVLEILRGTLAELQARLRKDHLGRWLPSRATFAVRSAVLEGRQELDAELGAAIAGLVGAKANLKDPDVTFTVVPAGTVFVFGIDLSGDDLGRRDYRIFLGPEALKGHIAASLVRLSGYDPKHVFLDLFCKSGVIPIEAALLATKRSPHFFGKEKFLFRTLPTLKDVDWDAFFAEIDAGLYHDAQVNVIAMDPSFPNISAAKKNAKIAGVIKSLTFSRTDLQFLDAKFGKHAIDRIVSLPPQPNVHLSKDKVDAMLKDIFYQAEFVLKKGGTCTLITRTGVDALKQYAKEYGFVLKEERTVWQGASELTVLAFQR